ncbi:MAG: hypothetical protein IJ198_00845 [Lachnospiraceae bacterium]|nr:hypothetical protein [Lachnospiraceae bacterium]
MHRLRVTAVTAAFCLAVMLSGCGRDKKENNAEAASSSDQVAEQAPKDELGTDSEKEESEEEEARASTDLFFEDGDVCTQFFRLTPPEEWGDGVSYHYFQEPETGRYLLAIVENSSMHATEGIGGLIYSIVVNETYPEERGMENSGYVGMLSSEENGFCYVFLEFPEGTQYTEATEETYKAAADTGSGIAANIEGRNGYSFEAGKEPETSQEKEE